EGHRAVMGESALDQHMTVKSSHLRNGENSDTSEGTGSHRQYLAVGNVGPQLIVRGTLQPEEGDVAGHNVTLQRTLGYLLGQASGHDQLVLHGAGSQLAGSGISTVEAHEGILL